MKAQLENIKISAITAAMPRNKIEMSEFYSLFGEAQVERISNSTGIRSVRVADPSIRASDLAIAAANELFKQMNIDPASVDGVVFVSQTPDFKIPGTSGLLQDKLGLKKSTVAFDINSGCSGYIYGLFQAAMLVYTNCCKRVLVCAGDVISKLLHPEDRRSRMIFSDASSATLVETGDSNFSIIIGTDGSGYKSIFASQEYDFSNEHSTLHHCFTMDGEKIMQFVLREVPDLIDEILHFSNIKKAEIDSYILHQPNKFILNFLSKKCNIPMESMLCAFENAGNTGPASIPVVLAANANQLMNQDPLRKVILCGFGSGLSWGAIATDFINTKIFPFIEVGD